jgi:hypothetical protein
MIGLSSAPAFADQCFDTMRVTTVSSYPRLSKLRAKRGITEIITEDGFAGDLSSLYLDKIIATFDLYAAREPMTLKIGPRRQATVTVKQSERDNREIHFQVKDSVFGNDEIIIREKGLYQLMAESSPEIANQLKKNPSLARFGRVQGSGAYEALIAYAGQVAGKDEAKQQQLKDLQSEFAKASDLMYVDYMMINGLPEVVLKLEKFMQSSLTKDDVPSEATMKSIRGEFKGADELKAWQIGDQDYIIVYATKGDQRYLEIDSDQGVTIRIHLNSFNPKAPVFSFVQDKKPSTLRISGDDFTWEGKPQGEELRIVFALELIGQRMQEH